MLNDIPKMISHLGRTLFGTAPKAKPINLKGKHAIVTGASPGSIGFETAKTLASWGARVTITTQRKPEETVQALIDSLKHHPASVDITGHTLDLTLTDSVEAFAAWYQTDISNRLDILINNAGIHLDLLSQWQQPNLTADGFEIHWRTNFLGNAMLTECLLDSLKRAGKTNGQARVVNVSSHLHKKGMNSEFFSHKRPYNSWEAYGQSKLAVVHHAFEINRRYGQEFNINGYALHPGAISTNIAGKGLEGNSFLQTMRNLLAPIEALILMSPEEGAQTQISCATDSTLAPGKYYERCTLGSLNPEANDVMISAKLWDETQCWIQETRMNTPDLGNTINKKMNISPSPSSQHVPS